MALVRPNDRTVNMSATPPSFGSVDGQAVARLRATAMETGDHAFIMRVMSGLDDRGGLLAGAA
jgi:hypothetical protein